MSASFQDASLSSSNSPKLNPQQAKAVLGIDGPMLVLAGAGIIVASILMIVRQYIIRP